MNSAKIKGHEKEPAITILLIDNDSNSQKQLATILTDAGYEILQANDAAKATSLFSQKSRFDLVLADVLAPGIDGSAILRAARGSARTRRIPFVVCSAVNDGDSIRSTLQAGATDFVLKPINKELLLGKLQNAMARSRSHILLVDDNQVLLDILSRIIHREGFSTLLAQSGEEALELLGKEKVCAIISDIAMPGMNGLELLVAVKEKQPSLPVILITGHGGDFTREQVIAAGADGFVTKPFKNTEIANRLAVLIP